MDQHLAHQQRQETWDDYACQIYDAYERTPPFCQIVPTLHGPRQMAYHVVPIRYVKMGWWGERFAGGIHDKGFVSELVAGPFVRYALTFLYHLHSEWCSELTRATRKLTAGPSHYRAMEIELGLARLELSFEKYEHYWQFRTLACCTSFFNRPRRIMDATRTRIDRIADLFEKAGVLRGRIWNAAQEFGK